jgi:hypothetical protein
MPSTELTTESIAGPMEVNKRRAELDAVVDEFINLRYELSLWVDDGLMDLGERFEQAIEQLVRITNAPTNATQSTPSKQGSKVIPFAK